MPLAALNENRTERPSSLAGVILRSTLRAIQLIISLVIMGIYGVDLRHADKTGVHADGRWVFAEIVAGLSFITAVAYLLPMVKSWKVWPWDGVLFIFYTALFGAFGNLYIKTECNDSMYGCGRHKSGVWVDLVGMLLWLVSFVAGALLWRKDRHSRSTFTGRSAVV